MKRYLGMYLYAWVFNRLWILFTWVFRREVYKTWREAERLWKKGEEERKAAFKRQVYSHLYGGSPPDYWDLLMQGPEKSIDWHQEASEE